MKYNIKRDGVEIASDVEEQTYTDVGLEADTEYNYTVEISGVEDSEASVTTATLSPSPKTNIFVSNKELTWDDLPAWNQPDNGSLKLLSSEVKDNVPVVVETGKTVERPNFKTRELEQVLETVVQYETRATFTYEADFSWWNHEAMQTLDWLVDVLEFKGNQLAAIKGGDAAFVAMPATELTALPDLDTSNLSIMKMMFANCFKFNQALDNFDTSNVAEMGMMFTMAAMFNKPLDHFDTSKCYFTDSMHYMFQWAARFDQNLSGWCVENVNSKPLHFDQGSGFENKTIKQPRWGRPC